MSQILTALQGTMVMEIQPISSCSDAARSEGLCRRTISSKVIIITRPKPACGRQGLEWDRGARIHFGVFSTSCLVPLALVSDWIFLLEYNFAIFLDTPKTNQKFRKYRKTNLKIIKSTENYENHENKTK